MSIQVATGFREGPRTRAEDKIMFEHLAWPYMLLIPVLYALGFYTQWKKAFYRTLLGRDPAVNCFLVDGISATSRRVLEGAAKWGALDATYNFERGAGSTILVRAIDTFWMHIRNAQAVRNRLKIATEELHGAALHTAAKHGSVKILSLAAGSAQGVIAVLAAMRRRGILAEAVLVDLDPTALEYAMRFAREAGVEDRITTHVGHVHKFPQFIGDFRPDIVEMMGMTDYLPDSFATAVFRKIQRHLRPGGYFFTCHIHPNAESYFLRHAVNWDMLYRTKTELERLVRQGGFHDVRLETEPHGIHSVSIARTAA